MLIKISTSWNGARENHAAIDSIRMKVLITCVRVLDRPARGKVSSNSDGVCLQVFGFWTNPRPGGEQRCQQVLIAKKQRET